jgi:hypothetical protein
VADQIESDHVLPPGEVGDVHPETTWEHAIRVLPSFVRLIAAVIGTIVVFVVIILILFSNNPELREYRTGAWGLFAAFAGACVSYLFGEFKTSQT